MNTRATNRPSMKPMPSKNRSLQMLWSPWLGEPGGEYGDRDTMTLLAGNY